MLVNPRMLHVLPLIIWSAMCMSVFAGLFVPLMTRCMRFSNVADYPDLVGEEDDNKDARNAKSLIVMILLGIGEIIGGNFVGLVRDKLGNRVAIITQIALTILGVLVVIIQNEVNTFGWYTWIMCFLWGF